ncbi:peptidyl-alpha-hydroxyglycine alpha-amidating lyase 2 isoform X2 [Tribolium castaneum]|uniref:peptidyl-alpha-hydroxyglycine alpha-amidating lyase 2 isoform X2 n=1 Tax=Tribolium castaneum TaxID=7070 RepID=UPI00046BED14|nr:PREDICTED: peptidyl-alpha-hydroxyglycine alpha-amidating lyase 2 isoform X2 [Tribolium castaneum]|eukprot:XP_008195286.1 PREDICTED: peptidyl-alpha-hydroxyglycine alpha-amidating lyase 2 isoform X2 [Tribolium castaneum]
MNVKRQNLVTGVAIFFVFVVVVTVCSLKAGVQNDAPSEQASDKPDVPRAVKNWPKKPLKLGQVSGVSVNSAFQPVIFHRADRVFDQYTFNSTNHFQQLHLGPIAEPTVLTLDPQTGQVLGQWGENFFFMPHGLTIDRHDNLWVTDVALHQAFKFKPGELSPILTFGQRLTPGSSKNHLCMPTSIAVASEGEVFIADGYCNSRILKFNAAGVLLRIIPSPPEFLSLQVPHGVALIESLDRLCVADRENMRVTCPRAGLYSMKGKSEPALTIQQPDMGRVFGVAAKGKLIYAVNGPTNQLLPVQGLTIDPQAEAVIDHWAPEEGFGNPHAIAVCPNGSALYVAEIGPNRIWKFELVPPKKK